MLPSTDPAARAHGHATGRGAEGQCTDRFVEMFANDDSLRMPSDVRRALAVLLAEVAERGLAPAVPRLDIVEGISLRPRPLRER